MFTVRLASVFLLASLMSCGLRTDPRPPKQTTVEIGDVENVPMTNGKTSIEMKQRNKQITPKHNNR